jgi:hypothetical protein
MIFQNRIIGRAETRSRMRSAISWTLTMFVLVAGCVMLMSAQSTAVADGTALNPRTGEANCSYQPGTTTSDSGSIANMFLLLGPAFHSAYDQVQCPDTTRIHDNTYHQYCLKYKDGIVVCDDGSAWADPNSNTGTIDKAHCIDTDDYQKCAWQGGDLGIAKGAGQVLFNANGLCYHDYDTSKLTCTSKTPQNLTAKNLSLPQSKTPQQIAEAQAQQVCGNLGDMAKAGCLQANTSAYLTCHHGFQMSGQVDACMKTQLNAQYAQQLASAQAWAQCNGEGHAAKSFLHLHCVAIRTKENLTAIDARNAAVAACRSPVGLGFDHNCVQQHLQNQTDATAAATTCFSQSFGHQQCMQNAFQQMHAARLASAGSTSTPSAPPPAPAPGAPPSVSVAGKPIGNAPPTSSPPGGVNGKLAKSDGDPSHTPTPTGMIQPGLGNNGKTAKVVSDPSHATKPTGMIQPGPGSNGKVANVGSNPGHTTKPTGTIQPGPGNGKMAAASPANSPHVDTPPGTIKKTFVPRTGRSSDSKVAATGASNPTPVESVTHKPVGSVHSAPQGSLGSKQWSVRQQQLNQRPAQKLQAVSNTQQAPHWLRRRGAHRVTSR